jgi:SAM-dependent methyltransferase
MSGGADVPPDWRLPEGVNAALWQYAQTPRLAVEEADYFRGHPLLTADARALAERFVEPGPLIDLGSGAGRLALRFAGRGFPVVAVDLSRAMLDEVRRRSQAEGLAIDLVMANLCRLDCFRPGEFAYALAMFSTLGMIRGPSARRRALAGAARLLRPGGRLALHAHNIWLNARDAQGRAWLLGQVGKALRGRPDLGDRRMTYRGIPKMEVHLYRYGELRRELRGAGLMIDEVLPLDAVRARPIAAPWLLPGLRAGGWLVFARRPS